MDGESYEGRLSLKRHASDFGLVIQSAIRSFADYHAGRPRPAHQPPAESATIGPISAAATFENGRAVLLTTDPTTALHELTGWAKGRGEALEGLSVTPASLEDVYLGLTGDAAQ